MGILDEDTNEPLYEITKNFEDVIGSLWEPHENKIGLNFIKWNSRPAIEQVEDIEPKPYFYATTTKPLKYSDFQEWMKAGRKGDPPKAVLPVGTTLKAVMKSRFGDIGYTNNLIAESGYIIRLHPFQDDLKNIRLNP